VTERRLAPRSAALRTFGKAAAEIVGPLRPEVGSSGGTRTEEQASTPADSQPLDPDRKPTWATICSGPSWPKAQRQERQL